MASNFKLDAEYIRPAVGIDPENPPANPVKWLDENSGLLGGVVVLSAGRGLHAPLLVPLALRRGLRVATSANSRLGEALKGDATNVSGFVDASNTRGFAVSFEAVATRCCVSSRNGPAADTEWAGRASCAKQVFCTRERLRGALANLSPADIRGLSRPVSMDKAPADWMLIDLSPFRFRFTFMGGADRCHGYVDYRKSQDSWTNGGLHA